MLQCIICVLLNNRKFSMRQNNRIGDTDSFERIMLHAFIFQIWWRCRGTEYIDRIRCSVEFYSLVTLHSAETSLNKIFIFLGKSYTVLLNIQGGAKTFSFHVLRFRRIENIPQCKLFFRFKPVRT